MKIRMCNPVGEEGYKHTPVIVSGCHSRMRDEGTSFSGETKVSETFNGEAVWPKEKMAEDTIVRHAKIIGNDMEEINNEGGVNENGNKNMCRCNLDMQQGEGEDTGLVGLNGEETLGQTRYISILDKTS
ncbi:hypothetical protein Tco_1168886 [Tanacetum coccineum]